MRLWSIHPQHLDAPGLVALWREGLLARSVIQGSTKGYRQHPQLERFLNSKKPLETLDYYLSVVFDEAVSRDYQFDKNKIIYHVCTEQQLQVTTGQIDYEWAHLLKKLNKRNYSFWAIQSRLHPRVHPCFKLIEGPVESWEREK